MEFVANSYIAIDPEICGGKPHVVGHRITVLQIAIWHEIMGKSVDEIATEYDLTLSEIYAGLAYYFDHREEVDEMMRESEHFVRELQKKIPSKINSRSSAA